MVERQNPSAVADYIAKEESQQKRDYLNALRTLIKEVLPEAFEGLAWAMPSYWQGSYLIHFQAYKNHVNVYIGPEGVAFLQTAYPELSYTKRGFKLDYTKPLPDKALKTACQWALKRYGETNEA